MHARCNAIDNPEDGMIVANDCSDARMVKLQARARRQPRDALLMMAEDAARFPALLNYTRRHRGARKVKFDRVLCDVPCSGDGTFRKSVRLWKEWSVVEALTLHHLQLNILKRGIQLLAHGGRLVYSTCSLNPIECEDYPTPYTLSLFSLTHASTLGCVRWLDVNHPPRGNRPQP